MTKSSEILVAKLLHLAKDYYSPAAFVIGSIAAPTAAEMTFRPPGPSQTFVLTTFVISEAFVVAISIILLRASSLRTRGAVMLVWAILFAVCVIVYQYVWSGWVAMVRSDPDNPVVTGYALRTDVETLVQHDRTLRTKRELLENFNRDPEEIWTDHSRAVIETSLFVTWLLYWLSPFGAVAAFFSKSPWPTKTRSV